jgi:hypothetical protein
MDGRDIGSGQNEAGAPASEFCTEIWYFSCPGLLNNDPKSTNSSFQIFSLNFEEI